MGIIKIIGAVFGYLLCGTGVLELIRLHDRHADYILLDYDDESEQVIAVILFPVVLVCLIPWLIGKFVFVFIKVVQMIFTTLTYIIVALIKGKDKEQTDDNT